MGINPGSLINPPTVRLAIAFNGGLAVSAQFTLLLALLLYVFRRGR